MSFVFSKKTPVVLIAFILVIGVLAALPGKAFAAEQSASIVGDLNGDGFVSDADAIYLLMYTFFPDMYPVSEEANTDFDGDGFVSDADAIYLLMYTFFPDMYPLPDPGENPDPGGNPDPQDPGGSGNNESEIIPRNPFGN